MAQEFSGPFATGNAAGTVVAATRTSPSSTTPGWRTSSRRTSWNPTPRPGRWRPSPTADPFRADHALPSDQGRLRHHRPTSGTGVSEGPPTLQARSPGGQAREDPARGRGAVRERTPIEEVVGEHVTLRSAGVGSLKGLCPFHDEKSPSFHVRPQLGVWHCFGCGEGGDVISFVQKVDHLTFTEAVERLAGRPASSSLRGGRRSRRREQVGRRTAAGRGRTAAAEEFYAEQLAQPAEARGRPRSSCAERGFDRRGRRAVRRRLRARAGGGAVAAPARPGLHRRRAGRRRAGRRRVSAGSYDRFRGRLVWPIRDVTGDVVGFGARRLFDDDRIEAKYLNTPETPLYKKSQVLYGLDLAKKRHRPASGRPSSSRATPTSWPATWPASRPRSPPAARRSAATTSRCCAGSCGTTTEVAAGRGRLHVRRRRRRAEGRAAGVRGGPAVRRPDLRRRRADGLDPCELRQRHGRRGGARPGRQPGAAVRVRDPHRRSPGSTSTPPRAGCRRCAPPRRWSRGSRTARCAPEYARRLAGLARHGGRDRDPGRGARRFPDDVPAPAPGRTGRRTPGEGEGAGPGLAPLVPDPRDPVARVEREALECLLQVPLLVPLEIAEGLDESTFEVPAYRAVHHAIRAAGGVARARGVTGTAWAEAVRDEAPAAVAPLVTQLAVTPLPADTDEALARYAASVVLRLAEVEVSRRVGVMRSRVQRLDASDPGAAEAFAELLAVESQRRALRERIAGG